MSLRIHVTHRPGDRRTGVVLAALVALIAVAAAVADPVEVRAQDGEQRVLFVNGDPFSQSGLKSVRTDGIHPISHVCPIGTVSDPEWSPDGTLVAFLGNIRNQSGRNRDVWIAGADGIGARRVTADGAFESGLSWSPDGTKLAFSSDKDGDADIYVSRLDGSEPTSITGEGEQSDPAWSPDGARIAFVYQANPDGFIGDDLPHLYVMDADGSDPVAVTHGGNQAGISGPDWSPDGSQLAFEDGCCAPGGVFVINADGTGYRQIAVGYSRAPSWSPDGTKIAYEHCVGCDPDGFPIGTEPPPTDREIYLVSPDGTNPQNISNHPDDQMDPDWGPTSTLFSNWTSTWSARCASKVTLSVTRSPSRVTFAGTLDPAHAASIVVRTERKTPAGFKRIDSVRIGSRADGTFQHRIARPESGRCRVSAVWPGDADHRGARTVAGFRC